MWIKFPRVSPVASQVLRGLQQPGLQRGAAAADAGAGAAGVPGERRSHGAGAGRPGPWVAAGVGGWGGLVFEGKTMELNMV